MWTAAKYPQTLGTPPYEPVLETLIVCSGPNHFYPEDPSDYLVNTVPLVLPLIHSTVISKTPSGNASLTTKIYIAHFIVSRRVLLGCIPVQASEAVCLPFAALGSIYQSAQ